MKHTGNQTGGQQGSLKSCGRLVELRGLTDASEKLLRVSSVCLWHVVHRNEICDSAFVLK